MEFDVNEILNCIEAGNKEIEKITSIDNMNENSQVLTSIMEIANDKKPHFNCDVEHIAEQNIYVVSLNNMKIPFYKLTDLYQKKIKTITKMSDDTDDLTNKFAYIINVLAEEINDLQKESNSNRCHELALTFSKKHGGDIVTARLNEPFPNYISIHSWVEKDEYCIDYTNNLVMMREYYYLFVDEVINIILENDAKEMPDTINGINSVIYTSISNNMKVK